MSIFSNVQKIILSLSIKPSRKNTHLNAPSKAKRARLNLSKWCCPPSRRVIRQSARPRASQRTSSPLDDTTSVKINHRKVRDNGAAQIRGKHSPNCGSHFGPSVLRRLASRAPAGSQHSGLNSSSQAVRAACTSAQTHREPASTFDSWCCDHLIKAFVALQPTLRQIGREMRALA